MQRTPVGNAEGMGGVLMISAVRADGTQCPNPAWRQTLTDPAAESAALRAAVEWVAGGEIIDVDAREQTLWEKRERREAMQNPPWR